MSKKLAKWLYHFAALPLKAFKNDDIKGLSAKGNWPGNLEKQDKEFSSNGSLPYFSMNSFWIRTIWYSNLQYVF